SLVGYISFLNGQKAVNNVALQLRSRISEHIESHLSNFLKTPQQINQLNADSMQQNRLNVNNPEALEYFFWKQIQTYKAVSSIYFGNTQGGLVNSGREGASASQYIIVTNGFKSGPFNKFATDKKGNRGELLVTVKNFDARTRQWYIKAVDKGTSVWSSVYILFTGQDLAIAASRPVYDNQNNLIGVTSVDLFLSHITNFLKNLSIGKSGSAFLIERSGLMIAASNDEKLFTNPLNKKDRHRLKATESETPLIRFAAESLVKRFGDLSAITNKQNITFEISGKKQFLQVSPLQDEYGLDWLIAVVVPEADFMAQIKINNIITAVSTIITLLIVLLVGVFTARSIAKPILKLNDAALNLAKGELKQEIYSNGQIVELKTLTQSFNQMAAQLQQMLNDLNHEIIDRKQAEGSLRKSEAHLKTLIETIPDLIWLKDPNGIYLSCNSKFERFFGANESDIVSKTDYDFVDKELAGFFREKDKDVIAANKPIMNEEEVVYADDGHREILETIKTPMYDSENNLIGVLGIARDITLRKMTEDALRSEKEFTDKALNVQNDTFFLFDLINGKALRWNQSFKHISGYTDEEIDRMKAPDSYYSPKDLEKAKEFIQKVLKEGMGIIELDLICKNGNKVPTEYNASVIRDDLGKPKFFISIGRDITDRKKIESQLQQSQKMEAIGTLAGGIAHDFNNMLGVITGNVSYALNNLNKDDELYDVLSDIQESSKQAQNLTYQLLTFSKGGAPIKKVTDINKLINVSAVFSIRGTKAKCSFELSNNLWKANIDEGQINQVISNLMINANQAMPNGGTITIRTENVNIDIEGGIPLPAGRYIKIVVEDQGVGISKKHFLNIFEPYFTTKQKGSGLGLATTYSIIKRHDGHITVYSEIEKGTVFKIYLPAALKDVRESDDKAEPKHKGQGKILIMDDQEPILTMASRMLIKMGYDTAFATDGSQAIEMYKEAQSSENPFDLVILDLTVPGGMGGLKTIIELLKFDPNVKAAVSSGYSNDPIMAKHEDYGFCGVVPKPYTKEQLSEALNKIFSEND
ncbi:MAG: PAS domain S-box protein, partial [Desulfobacteraceae bacterium]|nr:PAS domain S-box protein [Desulfobacteraceae bacterium]